MHAAQTLGVGLVGWGFASTTFHAPLIQSTPGWRLAAVASSRATEWAAQLPGWAWEPTPEALFARPDVDVVVIPTPNDTHHRLAAQALAAGKHVVVDKPFTLTVAEADDLIARAAAAGRCLSVFHNRRWDSDFVELRQVLNQGVLGRVTHVESHFDRYRPDVRQRWRESSRLGGGLWYDLGPHLLDQALQLWGPPDTIWLDTQSQRDGAQTDDWCHAVLAYLGLRVVLHASALTARVAPRWVVHGTLGSYVKWGLDPQEDALKAGLTPAQPGWGLDPQPGQLTLQSGASGGVQLHDLSASAGDYSRYYAGLRQAVLGQTAQPPVTAHEAREVMCWIERGRQSQREGRWVGPGDSLPSAV